MGHDVGTVLRSTTGVAQAMGNRIEKGQVKAPGIDTSGPGFQLHGVDESGHVAVKKKLTRGRLTTFIGNLPPCVIGMEACSGAHYRHRVFTGMSHTRPPDSAAVRQGVRKIELERRSRCRGDPPCLDATRQPSDSMPLDALPKRTHLPRGIKYARAKIGSPIRSDTHSGLGLEIAPGMTPRAGSILPVSIPQVPGPRPGFPERRRAATGPGGAGTRSRRGSAGFGWDRTESGSGKIRSCRGPARAGFSGTRPVPAKTRSR
uniref:Transposase n=1 Tax=Candidatus Kentrum eta TaxID=2126337 RepID=A0A450V5K8_9GAMM|nr:MAG: hypothetical protein BECKH772A_GA0070896_101742 [Candidatus Kentron sp. H]VFJ99966.1 MAG: hypothetical protein BECKH772B_GA0070898_101753 [Candidatus Kentron sp. H]VFK04002.1 MAG: hypothetical protein BECKH772C_GA0070978_101564 [Candidatus Kentron sp. H]